MGDAALQPRSCSGRAARDGEKGSERKWFYSWVCCLSVSHLEYSDSRPWLPTTANIQGIRNPATLDGRPKHPTQVTASL